MARKFKTSFPSETELVMEREFDAPRELVFKAHTDPQLIPLWWGRRAYTTIVDKMDVRVGGKWRFIQRNPEGEEFAFNGEYREITAPKKLVNTFEFEGFAGHIGTEDYTFTDLGGGRSALRTYSVFNTKDELDGVIATGMEEGANETYDRLDEMLAEQLKAKV